MSNSFHISVGCRVEGTFGPLVPNPNPNPNLNLNPNLNPNTNLNPKVKRRVREKVCGTVIRAVDQISWEIVCNLDGDIKNFTLNSLKVVADEFGIPLHELVNNLNSLYQIITDEYRDR